MTRSSSSKRLQVFEFGVEDGRVEKASKTILEKFGKIRRNNRRSSPADKYKYLECFTGGSWSQRKNSSNEPFDVDAERIVDLDQYVKTQKKEIIDKLVHIDICGMDDECTCSVSSSTSISRENCAFREVSESNTSSGEKNYEVMHVGTISDDYDSIQMSSSSFPSFLLSDNKDIPDPSVLGVDAEFASAGNDIDIVNNTVVISPDFILNGDMYYTESQVTFSCNCIKVEGSTVNGTKEAFSFEWSIDDIISIESTWCGRVETAIINLILSSKDSTKAGTASEISGIELLKFAVHDQYWSQRQEAIKSLHERYTDIWEFIPDNDGEHEESVLSRQRSTFLLKQYFSEYDKSFEDVIYPKGDADAVLIIKRDVQLLQPETFINDTIIDFYMKYLKNKIQPEEQHRFHFFNSFFFRKLADLDKEPSSACESKALFERVRKWTRKVNIFEKDYIFIPVNYSLHWSLIVICHPKVACLKDDETEKGNFPCILHMDSIKGSHRGLKSLVQSYLNEEWKERHKSIEDNDSSKFLDLPFVPLELPQQQNSFDCGLFVLHYAELFIKEAPSNFNPCKITESSTFLTRNWFPPVDASLKRAHIKNLIYEIYEAQLDNDPSPQLSCNKNEEDTEVKFLGQTWNPMQKSHLYYSSVSGAEHVTGISTAAVSPLRAEQSTKHPKTVGREPYEQVTRSVSKKEHWRRIMSPIQEVEETADSLSVGDYCQQVSGSAVQTPTTLYETNELELLQETYENRKLSLQFDNGDEGTRGYFSSSGAKADGNRLPEKIKGSNQFDIVDIPESPPPSAGEFAICVVEDSQEEETGFDAIVVEDSEEEDDDDDDIVVEDSLDS